MPLQSALFKGDERLERAAVSNPDHVVPGDRGPHVVKIQQALIEVAGARITADGIYGPATATAVADFKRKHHPPILNYAGQIDNIVGIKTMAALDAMLPRAGGGGLQLNFDIVVRMVDVVINLRGAPAANFEKSDEALPAKELTKYSAATGLDQRHDKLGVMLHNTTGNLLLRISHTTKGIGFEGVPAIGAVIQAITDFLATGMSRDENSLFLDRVYLFGTSSGGRIVLDFPRLMVPLLGVLPHFIAPIDAAFANGDAQNRPSSNTGPDVPAQPVPRFPLPPGLAPLIKHIPTERRLNFFQAQGNHTKRIFFHNSSFSQIVYTSAMDGGTEEIHGEIDTLNNIRMPVPDGMKGVAKSQDEQRHEFGDSLGRQDVQKRILAELNV